MVTGWVRLAGGLRPAMLTATTRNSIFSPTGRSFTLNWFLSTRSLLATTHWSAKEEEQDPVFQPFHHYGEGDSTLSHRCQKPTSHFAVLNDVSVDAARSDLLRWAPLESAGGVGDVFHSETDRLASGG